MLIVCPTCATSYMLDPSAIPAAGRQVRCARCKATWAVNPETPKSDVSSFVDGVIAEAEAQTTGAAPTAPSVPATAEAGDDFGGEPDDTIAPGDAPRPTSPAAAEPPPPPPPLHTLPSADAPPLVPPVSHIAAAEHETASSEDVDSFVVRRERLRAKRQNKRKSSRWIAVILVLVAFNVAVLGARNEVVRYMPQTASLFSAIGLPVNLRNLKFENVRISKEGEGKGLVVTGTIVSTGNTTTEVPRLRFSVRNLAGHEVYTWTAQAGRNTLEPGEKVDFRSRLASPPADAADVLVRFFTSQDAAATGMK